MPRHCRPPACPQTWKQDPSAIRRAGVPAKAGTIRRDPSPSGVCRCRNRTARRTECRHGKRAEHLARDTVGGGGGARLICGDTANGPCLARVGRWAACVAEVSEGEVLMAWGPGGMSFGAASGCPEIMRAGRAGWRPSLRARRGDGTTSRAADRQSCWPGSTPTGGSHPAKRPCSRTCTPTHRTARYRSIRPGCTICRSRRSRRGCSPTTWLLRSPLPRR